VVSCSSRSVVLLGRRGQSFFSWPVSRLDRRGQSSWSVVLRGQSAFFLVVVVSLLCDQSFFVVSRLDRRGKSSWSVIFSWSISVLLARRGQSSWSVVLRGWCLYSMVVMHMYLLRHMAGENRGQCLDKCTGGG